MTDVKTVAGYLLAGIAILMPLFLPLWAVEVDHATLSVSLTKAQSCFDGHCTELAGGADLGRIRYLSALVVLIAIVFRGIVPALSGERPKLEPVIGAVLLAMLAWISAPRLAAPYQGLYSLEPTFWYRLLCVGPFVGLALVGWSSVERMRRANASLSTRPATLVQVPRRAAPLTPVRRLDAHVVPFAATGATAAADRLVLVEGSGAATTLPWSRFAAAIARELRDPTLPAPMIVLDLIPPGGAPARIVSATSVDLVGADGPRQGADVLRRVLALARAMQPDLVVENATTDFLYRGAALPTWTLDDLARYDERYARARAPRARAG